MDFNNRKKIHSDKIIRPIWYGLGCYNTKSIDEIKDLYFSEDIKEDKFSEKSTPFGAVKISTNK